MSSMRFIENEDKFLDYSWMVYESYFNNKKSFIEKYNHIDSPEKKNRFLRLTSYYFFFVKCGSYSTPEYDADDFSFVDQTYKFIAIIALIESMYGKNDHMDFYEWIIHHQKFPITNQEHANQLYAKYKDEYGSTSNTVKFFNSLDNSIKSLVQRSLIVLDDSGKTGELEEKEQSIEFLSKLLFQIRSDFVHNADLILEFDPSTVLSVRKRKPISCSIELDHICKIFESGLLQHFDIIADKKQI